MSLKFPGTPLAFKKFVKRYSCQFDKNISEAQRLKVLSEIFFKQLNTQERCAFETSTPPERKMSQFKGNSLQTFFNQCFFIDNIYKAYPGNSSEKNFHRNSAMSAAFRALTASEIEAWAQKLSEIKVPSLFFFYARKRFADISPQNMTRSEQLMKEFKALSSDELAKLNEDFFLYKNNAFVQNAPGVTKVWSCLTTDQQLDFFIKCNPKLLPLNLFPGPTLRDKKMQRSQALYKNFKSLRRHQMSHLRRKYFAERKCASKTQNTAEK